MNKLDLYFNVAIPILAMGLCICIKIGQLTEAIKNNNKTKKL